MNRPKPTLASPVFCFFRQMELLLISERWELFAQAIGLIFKKWTALQLALEHAEYSSEKLLEDLCLSTLEFFKEFNGQIEADELEHNFNTYYEEFLGCGLDDGSAIQVSRDLLEIFNDLVIDCNLVKFESMKAKLDKTNGKAQSAVNLESDDGMDEEDIKMEVPKENNEMKVDKGPIIDDDGFELVVRKNKKR